MPGKVNPSLAECMNMICFSVIGNDTTVSFAAQAGQFELNVMLPGMLKAVLDSTDMLTNFLPIFSANLIEGLTANQTKLRENIENSPVIVTTGTGPRCRNWLRGTKRILKFQIKAVNSVLGI